MKAILLIGACGSGKTWVIKKLITESKTKSAQYKLFKFQIDTETNFVYLGVYDGSTFEGSDKLSMAIMKDAKDFKALAQKKNFVIIAEGDRFTNKTFTELFSPTIIKITDDGEQGRNKRKSKQTQRHIKAIETRVGNIKSNYDVSNSTEAYKLVKQILTNEKNRPYTSKA